MREPKGSRMKVKFYAQLQSSAAPTGLRGVFGDAFPALKRWANIPCAYGAMRCEPLKSTTILDAIALRVSHGSYRMARNLAACALIAVSLAGAQPARVHTLVGSQAPGFIRRDLSGHEIQLATLRGKVVLLNFWATWCAPCQQEMPLFSGWQREYGSRGLAVIGISMDDDADSARKLVEKLKIGYPVAMGDANLGRLYGGVLGLPLTFVIGRDGKVMAQFQGDSDVKSIEQKIKSALD